MIKPFLFWLTILAGMFSWSQYFQYAPDLKWTDELKSSIGMANPTKDSATATLIGYSATGEQTGTLTLEIPALGRRSFTVYELFNTTDTRFLVLQSSVRLGAYVLYRGDNSLSTVGFSTSPGHQLFVPHIARDTSLFYTQTTVANLSSNKLPLQSQPYLDSENPESNLPVQLEQAVDVPSVSDKSTLFSFFYDDLYMEETSLLQWDRLKAEQEQGLVGVEHFGMTGRQMASLSLPRSPFQEMIISHLSQDKDHFWTGLVLVNTQNGIVPVTIQSYMEDGTLFQTLKLELGSYEKRTFTVGEFYELGISDVASWLKVTPYEQAVVGYQIFGSPDQTFMAGMEPAMIPTNMTTLPYTPTTDELWSGFGMINPTDEDICVQIGGLDDEGNIVSFYDCKRMDPHSKFITTVEDLFGNQARQITWLRLNTERGTMSAFSITGNRDRTMLSGLQGISTYNKEGTLYLANFEHDSIQTLIDQGWQETQFDNEWQWNMLNHFSIESYYEAVNGIKHLQAKMFPTDSFYWIRPVDQIAFVSPYFEIPSDKEQLYLSFHLRLVDPEYTDEHTRFSVIWREEGSSTWHWTGLTGRYIMEEMARSASFTVLQSWNSEVHQMTRWLPFEVPLPSSLAGSKIQVGLWYNLPRNSLEQGDPAAILWADFIRVTTAPTIPHHYQPYLFDGQGVFFYELP
ncbi:MAG: hypothetical protein CSA81_07035 [Acidobacteria bacterium]|nr:MAG: hypothetical protein CSA81_07035 [Acidobacteriota bacterium]